MLLLRPAPTATIVAETSGGNTGYGDGTVGFSLPGVAFGSLNFTPAFFRDQSRAILYVFTSASFLDIYTDGSLTGTAGKSVVIGADSYAFADATVSSLSGGNVRLRWSVFTPLVDATSYSFKVE